MSTSGAQSSPVNLTACDQVLGIPELAQEIIASLPDQPDSLRSVALTNKELSESALRQIWSSKKCSLKDILQFLPSGKSKEINSEDDHKIIIRDSDNFERLKKYTGYVREFTWGKEDDSLATTSESVDHLFESTPSHETLFPNLRALRWTSNSSEAQAIFSRLLGPSVVDVRIECPPKNVERCINIVKQRAPDLQRLEIDDLSELSELDLDLDGMDINEFETKCTLSEKTFLSLATMTHLTSLKLAIPEEGYKEVPGTYCFPTLRTLRLETGELGKHCRALVKMVSSGSLENVYVDDVESEVTTDMLESFVRGLVNYPLRAFSLTGTSSSTVRHDGLNIAQTTLHTLQPLGQHCTMTFLAIDIGNLIITPNLLSELDNAYPALEMLVLNTDASRSPELDILFTLADRFPALKEAHISATKSSKLLTQALPQDWHSPSKLSKLHIDALNDSWVCDRDRKYLKALFPHADITVGQSSR